MSIRRFFIHPDQIRDQTAHLSGEEAHHLRTVLRLEKGDEITLFDGTGMRYLARIAALDKRLVTATVLEKSVEQPSRVRVELGQSLLKGQKMEFVIQKATELGIDAILPFYSEHGVRKTKGDTSSDRWRRIALESCKQCDRALPPRIDPVRNFQELINTLPKHDLKLLFWEQEKDTKLADILGVQKQGEIRSACFLIGPEGGFCAAEVAQAQESGFIPVSLGSRTLRAETATVTAAAILQFLLGNLS